MLVVEDFLLLAVDCGELGIDSCDAIFLFDDFAEGGFDFWVDGFLLDEDLDLAVVDVGQGVAGFDCARFGDDERGGGFGAEGQAEAVVGGGGFFGLGRVGGEIPAGAQGVFDEERALGAVFVAGGVDGVLAGGAGLNHGAVNDADFRDALRLAVRFFVDADAEIGGVGDQALFAGLHGIHEAFAGEGFVFEDAEAAAVEGERAGIGEPQRAKRPCGAERGIPERDFFGLHVCLDDGDERGFVLVDCDAIFEFVFEEIAEIGALRGGEHAALRAS